jgi:membrane protein YqaA with SNARE-associated domain
LLFLSIHDLLQKVGATLQYIAFKLDAPGLLLVAAADSSFLSIPEGNDVLIVILSAGNSWGRMAYYVCMTVIGSILGCLLLYLVGRKGGSPLLRRRFSPGSLARVEKLYERYGVLTVVIPSILPPPTPFKVFVLSAGVFRLGLPSFLAAVAIGRVIRYSTWGILAVLYGDSVKQFIQQNLHQVGIGMFVLLCIAALITVGVALFRSRMRGNRPGF